jgi:hypothetical protein
MKDEKKDKEKKGRKGVKKGDKFKCIPYLAVWAHKETLALRPFLIYCVPASDF